MNQPVTTQTELDLTLAQVQPKAQPVPPFSAEAPHYTKDSK